MTSHLYHTGSITLQSPLPSLDNIASIPWQPLIDLPLERAAGGREIGKDGGGGGVGGVLIVTGQAGYRGMAEGMDGGLAVNHRSVTRGC